MMNVRFTPEKSERKKCLILVGGAGDTAERFQALADLLSQRLPKYTICACSLSQSCADGVSLLDAQEAELVDIFSNLTRTQPYSSYTLWCTSMGAYTTVRILMHPLYSQKIDHVIFFDPADYYISDTFSDPNQEITWSGYQKYKPEKPVISYELTKYEGMAVIDVVHLIVRNYSSMGYVHSDYAKRGEDSTNGFSRLNTEMVKKFYENVPPRNKGTYTEINNLPHGFIRDGNIKQNLENVAKIVAKLILRPL
jgi:hypothetical protein